MRNWIGVSLVWLALMASLDAQEATWIHGVRLFDGTQVIEATEVLVVGESIAAIGTDLEVPDGAAVVDGSGCTLMPGLIDGHTHTFVSSMLDQCARFGVTTTCDMFTVVEGLRAMRGEARPGRCEVISSGTLVTAPGGHGTQFGVVIPTITAASQAKGFVADRLAEGSDYIKIVYDDGVSMGFELPTVSPETLRALIDAAHDEGVQAVVHIHAYEDAVTAVEAGADGLVHTYIDQMPDERLMEACLASGAFMVPTLAVLESVCGIRGGDQLSRDVRFADDLGVSDLRSLRQGFPQGTGPKRDYSIARDSVRQLFEGGVAIVAGTDASNPGTMHGASMHRELELLVDAGLSPAEALAAATSVAAAAFQLDDRGRVAKGLQADLLLVRGDPTQDILVTRAIEGVWQRGARVDRDSYRAQVRAEKERVASGDLPTTVSDFDTGEAIVDFGQPWSVSTDQRAGGDSVCEFGVVDGGADETSHALEIRGTVGTAAAFPWSGAMFSPGARPFMPVDLAHCRSLSFYARGDEATHTLMMFAESGGMMPSSRTFDVGLDWSLHVFELASFKGVDPAGITAILFGATDPGDFSFQVDQIRFQ